jgi:palmitoyltransferase
LAVNYLLSFDETLIDIQDIEGLSALHLATMSGNARIVKKLLLKGANKSLKNKEGLLAADIAK